MTTPKSPREIAEHIGLIFSPNWKKYPNLIRNIKDAIIAERSRCECELLELKAGLCVEINKLEADRQELLEGINVAVEALKIIMRSDKTDYDYNGKSALNRFGEKPGIGKRFSEPKETAKDTLTTLNSLVERVK